MHAGQSRVTFKAMAAPERQSEGGSKIMDSVFRSCFLRYIHKKMRNVERRKKEGNKSELSSCWELLLVEG